MNRLSGRMAVIAAVAALGVSSGVWARDDLEVTMDVVPANAAADAATREIKLPAQASPTAQENAAFGLDTANKARGLRDGGSEFGKGVSEAARESGRSNSSSRQKRP